MLIDDTGGDSDTSHTWSADKLADLLSNIAPSETDPFTNDHNPGDLFIVGNQLYEATTTIVVGDQLSVGTNVEIIDIPSLFASKVDDVQIDGTSIVAESQTTGEQIANIPIATGNNFGVVMGSKDYGISVGTVGNNIGKLILEYANETRAKAGASYYNAVVPRYQHASVFYGLAKAAGDVTQSESSNVVGQYTDTAKSAIKSMLGVGDRLEDIEVEVTGTTPTITANSSTRYICGEVTEVTFTPPASGTTELIFTSGSTVPTLTLPSTVLMPEWFVIEPNRIYQISIENNRYGAVASWPVA